MKKKKKRKIRRQASYQRYIKLTNGQEESADAVPEEAKMTSKKRKKKPRRK